MPRPRSKGPRIRFGGPKRSSNSSSAEPLLVEIDGFTLEGRGVARRSGKALFVEGALPGEEVRAEITRSHRSFDEAKLIELVSESPKRIDETQCALYQQCGGCDLQHVEPETALQLKQAELINQLERRIRLEAVQIEPPIRSESDWGYRRKARMGINVRSDGQPLVGFRRRQSNKLIDVSHCPVLTPRLNRALNGIRSILSEFGPAIKAITHAELMDGDERASIELRVTRRLSDSLVKSLSEIAEREGFDLQLRDNQQQIRQLSHTEEPNRLTLNPKVQLAFHPGDFIQGNASVNQRMIDRALEWLEPKPEEHLLDLYSGLGNFSIPFAKRVGSVTAIEGSERMVERCLANAAANGINNLSALAMDLGKPLVNSGVAGLPASVDLIILDPPRQGAQQLCTELRRFKPRAVLYVACDPNALIRDTQILTQRGFKLSRLCLADMFPQTHHFETLALFEPA